jgi:hypothetical protein
MPYLNERVCPTTVAHDLWRRRDREARGKGGLFRRGIARLHKPGTGEEDGDPGINGGGSPLLRARAEFLA